MHFFLLSIVLLILTHTILIECESFTSTTHLTQLLKTEKALAKKLEEYLEKQSERIEPVEK